MRTTSNVGFENNLKHFKSIDMDIVHMYMNTANDKPISSHFHERPQSIQAKVGLPSSWLESSLYWMWSSMKMENLSNKS